MKKIAALTFYILLYLQVSAYPISVDHYIYLKPGVIAATPMPNLGSAANFALFTVTGAVGNTAISQVTGDIGTNVGAVSGFETAVVTGSTFIANSVTAAAVADLNAAYTQISNIVSTAVHLPVLGNGETLFPGVYDIAAAGSAAGILTLDAQGDPNAIFIFRFGGAFNTGAATTVLLANGASANNVFWVAEGAIGMAAGTIMKGTLIAHTGAVSMGANGNLEGRMLSTTGAVNIYADIINTPVGAFTWIGSVSNDWNTAANWRNNKVPTSTDQAYIGVSLQFFNFPTVIASSGIVNVGAVAFGTLGAQAAGVMVNGGSTLNILGALSYKSDAGSLAGYTCTLSGLGTINANSISITAYPNSSGTYAQSFASSVNNLNITNNISLTSNSSASVSYNAKFNLTGGTALLNGILQTNNTAGDTSSFLISPSVAATLQLVNANAMSGLSTSGTNIIGFNNPGSTVEYAGAAQNIYTDADISGLTGGVKYQSIKFSGTGIKTPAGGKLNAAGDYTTTLANDINNYVDFKNTAILFNGTTQNLAGGAGSGTILYNATFIGLGTKTLVSGWFSIASSGILTMGGSSTSTILATGDLLTLKSDSTGSASVSYIISAGPSITGRAYVERFVTGSGLLKYRNYRLFSSPVHSNSSSQSLGSATGDVYNLQYLATANSTYPITTSAAGGGFDKVGNPTIYLYREDRNANNAVYSGGNYIGVNSIINLTLDYAPAFNTTTNGYLPVANGFAFFFRGSKADLAGRTTFPIASSADYPNNVTVSQFGYLNQGNVPLVLWYNNTVANSYQTTLSYTPANTTTLGFNLVGNPYASTIDWWALGAANPTVNPCIYQLDPATNIFGTYNSSTGVALNNGSRYIASGQGFFVKAKSAGSTLSFTEAVKVNNQLVAWNGLLMGKPVANKSYDQFLRFSLSPEDTTKKVEALLGFNSTSTTKYNQLEDDLYVNRRSDLPQSMYLTSADSVNVVAKWVALPKAGEQSVNNITIGATTSGQFTFRKMDLNAIPELFEVWLIDRYMKDSLDVKHNNAYIFDVNTADSTTFGSNRFQLVIRQDPAMAVHLLSFAATKITSGNQLVWKTENEENYTNFTIERNTGGNAGFEVLGGYLSGDAGTYSFIDKSPVSTVANQYRIKLVDYNGTVSYSNIITIQYANTANNFAKSGLLLYPNPATSSLNMVIDQPMPITSYNIHVVNSLGAVVKTAISNSPKWQSDVSGLLPGTYVVRITNRAGNSTIAKGSFVKL